MLTLVIPCYNEAQRLPAADFLKALAAQPELQLLLVNDGSTDVTLARLQEVQRQARQRVDILDLAPNVGKAEAVRHGLQAALSASDVLQAATYVGYWDADLATPLEELPRFVEVMQARPGVQWVMGARVKMLGWQVQRSRGRHYVGRVFATCAASALGCQVYDTQCGAKLLRVTPGLASMLAEPMRSRWLVDVELLMRLRQQHPELGPDALESLVFELPLRSWCEVGQSKVKPSDLLRSLWQLWCLRQAYARRS